MVFDATVYPPKQIQVIQVSNTFAGLAWNPSGREFYVTGGLNDNVYVYSSNGASYALATTIPLGHQFGNGLLSNAPTLDPFALQPPAAAGIGAGQ